MARKNTEKVIAAFKRGVPYRQEESVWTDGIAIYSYRTRILWCENGELVLDNRSYSRTTSEKQKGIRLSFNIDRCITAW